MRDQNGKLGIAWLALCGALGLHIVDEAATGFLSVYNPTVLAIRERYGWLPIPTFEFHEWLGGLIAAILILLALAWFAFRGARWMRPLAYAFAVIMLLNGVTHTLQTVFGRTVASVRFERPMPGFYSSPVLVAASVYMLYRLRAIRPGA